MCYSSYMSTVVMLLHLLSWTSIVCLPYPTLATYIYMERRKIGGLREEEREKD